MNITELLTTFFDSQSGQLAILILILPVADWVSGVAAAVRDGTFELVTVSSVPGRDVMFVEVPLTVALTPKAVP